jgi:hypothetical protein
MCGKIKEMEISCHTYKMEMMPEEDGKRINHGHVPLNTP